MKFSLIFLIIIPILLYLFFLILRIYIYIRIVKHKHLGNIESIKVLKNKSLYDENFAKLMQKELFEIPIENKILIRGNYIEGKTENVVIFSHGFQGTRWEMTKYASWFFENGWHMVFFDFRNCGDSTGKISSLGGLEMRDLRAVVEWTCKRVSSRNQLVLFGESVGGAVSSVYSSQDSRISSVIADSIFSSAIKEVRSMMINTILPKWFIERTISDVTGWIQFFPGYKIADMNPEYSIMRTNIPMLFIHGECDMVVPPFMSWNMFVKRKLNAPTRVYLCKGAGFTESVIVNPKKYFNYIEDFFKSDSNITDFSKFLV